MKIRRCEKILSKNDVGETGSHQAGMAVPKNKSDLLGFFPKLDAGVFNPSIWITCEDPNGEIWSMRYIYYNGRSLNPPRSTRDEYRISHMTKFLKAHNAVSEDVVCFQSTEIENHFKISLIKASNSKQDATMNSQQRIVVLKGWKIIY